MKVKVKKLKDDAKLPTYGRPGDVALDMYSMETVTIPPMGHHRFWHGFALEFPEGYAAIVKDKSSISKAGLHTMGGVFDADPERPGRTGGRPASQATRASLR